MNKKLKDLEGWHYGGKGSGIEDELLELTLKGIKTATCSWYESHLVENVPIPQKGERSYIMDSKDNPRCIIELTSVEVMPFLDVSEEFAYLEGEGDRSYEYWRAAHEKFFSEYGKTIGLEWDSKTAKVVCEKFRVVEILD